MNSGADDDIHYSNILGESSSYHCLDNNNIHCSNIHVVVAVAAAAMDEVQVAASNNHDDGEAADKPAEGRMLDCPDESVEERTLYYDSMSSWGRALYSMHDHPVEPSSQGAWLSSTPPC
jgi:hypothetical protein